MTSSLWRFAAFTPSVALLLVQPLLAQQPSAAPAAEAPKSKAANPARPWLYQNSDVPMDPAWLFGELPNGLRYAIRRNGVPPGQVSIRMRIDVGSLMEKPEESGFAHYIEHLTFRGSRYVPDGEAKRVWQRLGATFGSDSNAQTTPTGTTFALDLPSASPEGLDESIKILAGMAQAPNIVPAAVDAERAVVLAEMRESTGPQSRLGDATRALLFAGQPLGTNPPIGTTKTLNGATAAALKAFHDRWYRPDRVVLSVSGDVDPKMLEELIAKHFSAWKGEGPATPLPDFGHPDPKLPASAVFVDPGVAPNVSIAYLRSWKPRADTIVYNQNKLADVVALAVINRRLERAARQPGASFISASVDQQDVSRSVDGTFIAIVPVGDQWEKAVRDVRAIIADASTTAPTKQEVEREYNQLDAIYAIGVENQDVEPGSKQAQDLVDAVDIRETTVSQQVALDIYRSAKPIMTPQRTLASTKRLFSGEATRALLTIPNAAADTQTKLTAAILSRVAPAANARLVPRNVSIDSLPKLGTPATVVAAVNTDILGIEMVALSNGVRLTLFPNDAEDEKVRVNVRFGHGQQHFSPTEAAAGWAGAYGLTSGGIANLDQQDIDDIINGRRIGMSLSTGDDAFEMQAVTRPADLKDQLRLIATELEFPRWDPTVIERLKAGLLSNYESMSQSPDAVINRDLGFLIHDKDVRFRTPSREEIAALTPEAFRATWEPILKEGPIEVQIFGDVPRETAIQYVAETLGALKPRTADKPPAANLALRFPAHNSQPVTLYHDGAPDQAAAVIAWPTSGGFAEAKDGRQLEILAQIMNDRLFEKLRSTDGAAYNPQVVNNWPFAFQGSGGYIQVYSQVQPDKIPYFYSFVDGIVKDLTENPVSEDELGRVLLPMSQMLQRASTGNAFWMMQVEGASIDRRYLEVAQSMAGDMLKVTPADIQRLAAKYLVPGKSWSAVVLPKTRAAAVGVAR